MIFYTFHIISGKLKSQLSRIFPFCKCLEETVEPLHREQENRILIYMITRTIMFILSSATMTNLDKCEFGGKNSGSDSEQYTFVHMSYTNVFIKCTKQNGF